MRSYIIGSSALYFWRRQTQAEYLLEKKNKKPPFNCPSTIEELRSLNIDDNLFGPPPIHLMTSSKDKRPAHHLYEYSIRKNPKYHDCFCEFSRELSVARPELCLYEAAAKMSTYCLMELCMEMCGYYSLVPEAERGIYSHAHLLTNIASIKSFIKHMPNGDTARKLSSALKYIEEPSRSPMETRQFLLMCLPKRFGGYGLPRATLNYRIALTENERIMAARTSVECDMCWPDKKVSIEYDGHDDHEARGDRARDASKRNVLLGRGYKVFTITGNQICNVDVFDRLVLDIAHAIGYYPRRFPHDWESRRAQLRQELFKSLSNYEVERFF